MLSTIYLGMKLTQLSEIGMPLSQSLIIGAAPPAVVSYKLQHPQHDTIAFDLSQMLVDCHL